MAEPEWCEGSMKWGTRTTTGRVRGVQRTQLCDIGQSQFSWSSEHLWDVATAASLLPGGKEARETQRLSRVTQQWSRDVCWRRCCRSASREWLCCCCLVAKSCLTPCDPVDCSPPGSSVHGIVQARILQCVPISFSRGSSPHRHQTLVSNISTRILHYCATWKACDLTQLFIQCSWKLRNQIEG